MARDLREDAARAVVQEAQTMADERCTPHGLWNCTACTPTPTLRVEAAPTLAEMVERLRASAAREADSPLARGFQASDRILAAALAEIDRRLTALEGRGLDPDIQRDATQICAFLDGCTAQITTDEMARWIGLPAARIAEVVQRAGLRHRWLVGSEGAHHG